MLRLLTVVTCLFGIGFYIFTLATALIHGHDMLALGIMAPVFVAAGIITIDVLEN